MVVPPSGGKSRRMSRFRLKAGLRTEENTMRPLLLTITFCLLLSSAASAQQPTATPDSQQASAQTSTAPVPIPGTEREGVVVSPQRPGVVGRQHRVGARDSGAVPLHRVLRAHSHWAQAIGRKWFFVIGALLRHLQRHHLPDRSAAHLLPGLRAPARLRPVEPDARQVGRRFADGAGGRASSSDFCSCGCPTCC